MLVHHTQNDHDETHARYGDMLRSMSLIGVSSLISIVLSILRLKILAIFLGPAGIGLFGLYNVILDLAASLGGLGVQASGVRQVALASATGDKKKIATIASVLTLVSLLLGLAGGVALAALAVPVAELTFGTQARPMAVALIGLAVFFKIMAGAPAAIIQGSRRIGDLARMTILGAVLNTIVAIPLVLLFGEGGVVPSLVAVALTSWLAALWYCRKMDLSRVRLSLGVVRTETRQLLGLGFAFMVSGLLTAGAAFAIRVLIVQKSGVDAAGNYQAAWALGGIYVGFILQAMGTDFYPKLSAVAENDQASNRMVNEQSRVSMLLAGPGLLATLALSPLIIAIFYSTQFAEAVPILRWLCLGMLLRVIAWPMGFLILAKGRQRVFLWTEIAATAVHIGLAYLLVSGMGPSGAGIAFAGLYLWHGVIIYTVVRRLSGFAWTRENLTLGGVFLALTVGELLAVETLPFAAGIAVGVALTAVASWFSLTQLIRLVPQKWIPSIMRPLVYRLLRHNPMPSLA